MLFVGSIFVMVPDVQWIPLLVIDVVANLVMPVLFFPFFEDRVGRARALLQPSRPRVEARSISRVGTFRSDETLQPPSKSASSAAEVAPSRP